MKKDIYYDKNGQEIKVGHVIKISNSFCKCDDGKWLVCNDYDGEGSLHIQKIGRGDKLSEAAYSCGFFPSVSFSYNVDKYEQQAWDQEYQIVEIIDLKNNEFIIEYFEEEIKNMKNRIENDYDISDTEIRILESKIAKNEKAIRTIKKEENIVLDIKSIEKQILAIENEIFNIENQKAKDEMSIEEFNFVIDHINSLLTKFYFINNTVIVGIKRTEFSKIKYFDDEGFKINENEALGIISKIECEEKDIDEVQIEKIKNQIINAKKRFQRSIDSDIDRIKKLHEEIEMLTAEINSKYIVNDEGIVINNDNNEKEIVEEVADEKIEDEAKSEEVKEYTTGRGTNEALIAAGKEAAGIDPEIVCHTYKKWIELGYQVMKGEKSKLKLELWHPSKYKNKDDEDEVRLYKKMTSLFTIYQVKKIEPDELEVIDIDYC